MPSSYCDSYPPIVKLLVEQNPRKVIDVGPGWGKYGLACHEYLPDLEALHAVEVKEGRLPTQDSIYNWVYVGDARDAAYNTKFWARWDTVLLVDVIEHMTLAEGHELLRKIRAAGCNTLVATPKVFVRQHDDHNPYETHQSLWDWHQFTRYRVTRDVSTIDALIYWLTP